MSPCSPAIIHGPEAAALSQVDISPTPPLLHNCAHAVPRGAAPRRLGPRRRKASRGRPGLLPLGALLSPLVPCSARRPAPEVLAVVLQPLAIASARASVRPSPLLQPPCLLHASVPSPPPTSPAAGFPWWTRPSLLLGNHCKRRNFSNSWMMKRRSLHNAPSAIGGMLELGFMSISWIRVGFDYGTLYNVAKQKIWHWNHCKAMWWVCFEDGELSWMDDLIECQNGRCSPSEYHLTTLT